MANLVEDTDGKIRCLPVSKKLRKVLLAAAEDAGVDTVLVTSGGQVPLGSPGKRKGSTRHDNGNAADLQLIKGNRSLNFTKDGDVQVFTTFVTSAVSRGATGVGAGVSYMGRYTIHVGYGAPAVWGGIGANAAKPPKWIVTAFKEGRNKPLAPAMTLVSGGGSLGAEAAQFSVLARDNLRLRSGPGLEYEVRDQLPAGRQVSVLGWDGPANAWARVDLQGDGLIDGHALAAYLKRRVEGVELASQPDAEEVDDVVPLLLADSEVDEPEELTAA